MLPPAEPVLQQDAPVISGVMRHIVRESKPPRKIHHLQFAMLDADEMAKLATIEVVSNGLYNHSDRQPTPYGPLDTRLGTSQKNGVCATCHEKIGTPPH